MTTKEENIKKWRLRIFKYGILPVLKVLDELIIKEKYEECQCIVDAIKEQNSRLDIDLPTELNEAAFNYVLKEFKGKFTYEWLNNSTNYYTDLLIKEINKQNLKHYE